MTPKALSHTVTFADHTLKDGNYNTVVQFTVTTKGGSTFLLDYCTYIDKFINIPGVSVSALQTLEFMGIHDASLTSERLVWGNL
jgi:hypothetical protein